VCIPGRGNLRAFFMLVGEAPGRAEAETGLPFMGASGQLLESVLDELGMTDDVYITNIARCRPPSNREPTTEEREICSPLYLYREIELVRPRLIVAMGRVSMDVFGIQKRKQASYEWWLPTDHRPPHGTVGIYHPAYCLRNGKAGRRELVRSLQYAKSRSHTEKWREIIESM